MNIAEIVPRFNCCLQGADHPSLVVIHRRFTPGRVYRCKPLYSVEATHVHPICAAFLDRYVCTHGQWSWYGPNDEDGSRRNQSWAPRGKLICESNLSLNDNFSLSWIMEKFSMWSHDVIATSVSLAGDLKIGQYLKIPPRVMFLTQVWGTIFGWSFACHT